MTRNYNHGCTHTTNTPCTLSTKLGLARTIHIWCIYMVILARKSPNIRSNTVYIYTVLANSKQSTHLQRRQAPHAQHHQMYSTSWTKLLIKIALPLHMQNTPSTKAGAPCATPPIVFLILDKQTDLNCWLKLHFHSTCRTHLQRRQAPHAQHHQMYSTSWTNRLTLTAD